MAEGRGRQAVAPRVTLVFAAGTLVESMGAGLLLATGAVYYLRYAGVSPAQVGAGIMLGTLAGMVLALPAGRLADRTNAATLLAILQLAAAAGFAVYPWMHGFGPFLVLVTLSRAIERCLPVVRGTVIGAALPDDQRVAAASRTRAAFNVGNALGILAAAPILASGDLRLFGLVGPANAAVLVVSALLTSRLAQAAAATPRRRRSGWRWPAARVLAVVLCNGALRVHDSILTVALPVWIVYEHRAPTEVISVLLLLNTAIVVLMQTRIARGARDAAAGGRRLRRAGWTMTGVCLVLASTGAAPVPLPVAVALLVVAVVALTVAEIEQITAGWILSYALAEVDQIGLYQALFSYSGGIQEMFGPLVVLFLVVHLGPVGWIALAAAATVAGQIAAGLVSVPVTLRLEA